jgi:outer membrane immunogenic protein
MRRVLLAASALVAFAAPVSAADLGAPRMPIAAAVVAPVFSWTGFYVGADVGYWTSSTNLLLPALALSNGSPKPNGIALGGHLGYRYQFANNFVLGAEADLAWLGNKTAYAALAGFAPASWALRATWNSSIRATAGISVDRALFYVTGGVSFLGINGCGVDNPAVSTACRNGTQFSGTRTGWTLGAGVDYAVTTNVSVRGEYLYANYGTRSYVTPGSAGGITSAKVETHTVRLGLNYMFTTVPSAVVARY